MAKKRTTRPSPAFQIQPPVHVYKVALKGQPTAWRRIEISSTQTLDDLHQAIFEAFDRYEEHLYAFTSRRPERAAAAHSSMRFNTSTRRDLNLKKKEFMTPPPCDSTNSICTRVGRSSTSSTLATRGGT